MTKVFETEWLKEYIKARGLNLHKMFVDIGAGDGEYCSNSLAFIEQGWEALLIDGLEANIEKCKQLHVGRPFVKCIHAILSDKVEKVCFVENKDHWSLSGVATGTANRTTSMLSAILKDKNINSIGIMSIDIEGNEWKVLMDLLINGIYPQVLIVEGNTFEEMQFHRDILEDQYKCIGGILLHM
jgi:FkbM family methyltransferase